MENETMVSKGGLSAAYTDKWEQRASIRTRPGKFIDFTIPGAFFPEENQPIFLADMMSGMDNERKSKYLLSHCLNTSMISLILRSNSLTQHAIKLSTAISLSNLTNRLN